MACQRTIYLFLKEDVHGLQEKNIFHWIINSFSSKASVSTKWKRIERKRNRAAEP
jgi:hypothetical protein